MATDRVLMAARIHGDARYARRQFAEHTGGHDGAEQPGRAAAAQKFVRWCDAASMDLLYAPGINVEDTREQWRREADASDIRFTPPSTAAEMWRVIGAVLAVVFAAAAFAGGVMRDGLTGMWILAGALWAAAAAEALYAIYRYARPRRLLAVGPAVHTDSSHWVWLEVVSAVERRGEPWAAAVLGRDISRRWLSAARPPRLHPHEVQLLFEAESADEIASLGGRRLRESVNCGAERAERPVVDPPDGRQSAGSA